MTNPARMAMVLAAAYSPLVLALAITTRAEANCGYKCSPAYLAQQNAAQNQALVAGGIEYGEPWKHLAAPGMPQHVIAVDPLTGCHWIKRVADGELTPRTSRDGKSLGRYEFKFQEGARPEPPELQLSVYFIQPIGGGLVKIGVSRCPETRLAALQTGCPVPLEIVKAIPAIRNKTEREIHRAFAAHRVRGEWFQPTVLSLELPQ